MSNLVEDAEVVSGEHQAYRTVQLLQGGSMVLIPTPSPDPKVPLHLHRDAYSAIAVLVTSGLAAVFPSVLEEYPPEDATRATDLMVYPTLFMGIGNLFSMPLCVALGRRPSLSSHITGRNIYSLAAGQSEALAPLIVEEIHFLHERSAKLSWFVGFQTVVTAAMLYLIATFINAAVLVLAFFFVVETKFDRPRGTDSEFVTFIFPTRRSIEVQELIILVFRECLSPDTDGVDRETHILQPEVFGSRTWRHDVKIFHFKPDWIQTVTFYKETAQSLCLLSIVWMLWLNGAFLGIYVYQSSTFAVISMAPPCLFQYRSLGYVQLVQFLDCALFVPLLGYGSDMLVRALSKWRNGTFQPEYRLILLSLPVLSAITSCVFFGQAGTSPDRWHWMTIVAPCNFGYFSFIGANLIGITYIVDSFPRKAGPLLLVLCAGRGFISSGLSYSTFPLINLIGYNGAMNVFAIVSGVLGVKAFPVYYFGARIRIWATNKV
ncbi:LOW QUALITY PROTEIN: uncharacterized protein LY79DRAFT_591822 [Colletotrichum navitas]|uniref:Major facilitator superfamily transporter n=1 Tax=Colletotrichum navitas TaxID=681940 RepID=A0AAD8V2J9_9PEZI|nr:LOW QUALITY PROTEIN: uncharacterized protein LY79DRAFT_591822 [Colletotrichum navitas]KAK1584962.1 LOW QUALITY PROTEIN: hypothetical protein LY79DRAFT_591822 [Colletotrichum navitas]